MSPDRSAAAAAPSRSVELHPNLTSAEALKRIGSSCLTLIVHNEALALDDDPEGVHQMRVSVRRLRAALLGFRKSLPSDQYEWINGELRWLADVLGEARDLDVFEHSLLGKSREHVPDVRRMATPIKQLKRTAYEHVRQVIGSPRYVALKFGLSRLFEAGEFVNASSDLKQKIGETAPKILSRRYRKARKLAKGFEDQSEKKRHRLRIALKKLRYSSELFGGIFDPKMVDEFSHQLKQLQDDLGDANDVRAGREIVSNIINGKANPDLAHAGHQMLEWHERRITEDASKTHRHMTRFLGTAPFWNLYR